MTNFLSRLITRTTERAPIVKPRPQSLYEQPGRAPQMPPVATQEDAGQDLWSQRPSATDSHAPAESVEIPVAQPQKRAPTTEPLRPAAQDGVPAQAPEPASDSQRIEEKSAKDDVTALPSPTRPSVTEAQPPPATRPTTPSPPADDEEPHQAPKLTGTGRDLPTAKTVAEHREGVRPTIRELFVERIVARERTTPPAEAATRPSGRTTAFLRPQPAMPSSGVESRRDRQPEKRPHDFSDPQTPRDERPAPSRPTMAPESSRGASSSSAAPPKPDRQDGNRQAIPAPAMALYPQATVPVLTPAGRPADERQSSEPEPTVRVHIGRIEVRATPPPAEPAKKPRRKTPVMSLDDYLERRNGRGKTG